MSVWEAGRVWRDAPHKGAMLNVLMSAAYESSDDGVCFLKVKSLARDARVTERAAQAALRKLEACGDLVKVPSPSGRGVYTRYQLGVKFLHPSNQKGVNVVPERVKNPTQMGERSSSPLFRENKTYVKNICGGDSQSSDPKPPTAVAPCSNCEGTGWIRLKARPAWTIYCECPNGEALRIAEGKPLPPPGVNQASWRRARGSV